MVGERWTVRVQSGLKRSKARQGKARQGKARRGKARQGKARQSKARGKVLLVLVRPSACCSSRLLPRCFCVFCWVILMNAGVFVCACICLFLRVFVHLSVCVSVLWFIYFFILIFFFIITISLLLVILYLLRGVYECPWDSVSDFLTVLSYLRAVIHLLCILFPKTNTKRGWKRMFFWCVCMCV